MDPWSLISAMLYFLCPIYRFNNFTLVCPYIWQPYLRWVSKRAWYIVLSKGNLTKYLIFERRQFALFSFSLRFSRWYLNVRCSSSISPRYFVLQMIFIFCPLILKFMFLVIFLFLDLKKLSYVLPEFNKILFALNHSTICLRS